MQVTFRLAGLALTLMILSLAARAETTQCTAITSMPAVISTPGVYCLKRSFSADNGINIRADDVTIDFNGFGLNLGITGKGVVASDRSNVIVRNGTIRGGTHGIDLSVSGFGNSSGNVVERMHVVSSSAAGIAVQGDAAVVRHNVVIGVAENNTPGVKYGISVSVGTGILVSDNQVLDTGIGAPGDVNGIIQSQVDGIHVVDAPRAVIENNVVSNHTLSSGSQFYPVGIHIYTTGSFTDTMKSKVLGNRVANMVRGIFNAGGLSISVFQDNVVINAITPYFGGIMVGTSNSSF